MRLEAKAARRLMKKPGWPVLLVAEYQIQRQSESRMTVAQSKSIGPQLFQEELAILVLLVSAGLLRPGQSLPDIVWQVGGVSSKLQGVFVMLESRSRLLLLRQHIGL